MLNGDLSHINPVLGILQQLPPTQLEAFYDNRLYGLIFHSIFDKLITIEFAFSHVMDILVQFLLFLLTKDIQSTQAQKEQKDLLSVLRLCTCRDATRFRNENVKTFLINVCGKEGEAVSSIAWFYREFCLQWIQSVCICICFDF